MKEDKTKESDTSASRRRLLKALTGTGGMMATGAVLPTKWVSPVVDSIMLPAHAQTSLVVGNYGPAMLVGGRLKSPSVLDLVAPRAEATVAFDATVGNVSFDAFWTVRESDADICGLAYFLNAAALVTLGGTVGRSGNLLGDFQQDINGRTLHFTSQQVDNNGVHLTAMAGAETSPLFAAPGAGCGAVNISMSMNSSSPYPDDEDTV
ncbi:MAG: twin-arginine translocation signal domain-containing protein [Arenicellales bacterium]